VQDKENIDDVRVSVITVCFNAAKTIRQTLSSVVGQTYSNIEYLVIDGGSSDKTISIVEEYRASIDIIVSESDNGIGDAWNKGILRSSGELILLLNADDELFPDSIERMVAAYLDHQQPQAILYGETQFIDESGRELSINRKAFERSRLADGFGFMFTTCVFPRSLWDRVGSFDPKVSIAVDTDWLMRALDHNVELIACSYRIRMREGGVSDKFKRRAFAQYHRILRQHGFSRLALAKARARHELALSVVALRQKHPDLVTQLVFIAVRLSNLLYNMIPTFALKRRVAFLLRMRLGKSSFVHAPIRTFGTGSITIGDHSVVNRHCYFDNRDTINIGSSVSIAHNVRIYTGGHDIDAHDFAFTKAPVRIDDYAVLFSNVIVQPGVVIGHGAVVLPGAVVTRDVAPYSVVGGNPARHVKDRPADLDYRFHYDYWMAP